MMHSRVILENKTNKNRVGRCLTHFQTARRALQCAGTVDFHTDDYDSKVKMLKIQF